jgi:hypothetical protein
MLRSRVVLFGAALLALTASGVRAAEHASKPAVVEADRDVLVNAVRANRRALVAVNLALSSEQAAQFWPLYDRYQAEINAIGDRVLTLVGDYVAHYADLSNEKALQLMTDYIAAEAERVKVRQTYLPEFAKILPGRTVARFYQIENKIDAVLRYELAATIPVIEQPAGAGGGH